MDHMCNSLDLAVQASVLSEKNRLELLAVTLQGFAPQKKVRDQKAALMQASNSLDLAVQASVLSEKNRLELLAVTLQGFAPQKKVRDQKAALFQIEQAISSFVLQLSTYRKKDLLVMQARLNHYDPSKKLQELKERHLRMAEHLKSLNPKTILKRGFCIPQNKQGAIIRSVEDISLGENLDLIFYNGTIGAHVDGVRSSLQET
jgi:exonuclease VII large subunit